MLCDSLRHDEIRRVLIAAADVIFSDGVSDAFLDHWAEETLQLLLTRREAVGAAAR